MFGGKQLQPAAGIDRCGGGRGCGQPMPDDSHNLRIQQNFFCLLNRSYRIAAIVQCEQLDRTTTADAGSI